MSNKPNVDEFWVNFNKYLPNPIVGNLAGFETWFEGWLQAECNKARQQTCDDIVGLVPEIVENPYTTDKTAHHLTLGMNTAAQQTIDAINKYKGEM